MRLSSLASQLRFTFTPKLAFNLISFLFGLNAFARQKPHTQPPEWMPKPLRPCRVLIGCSRGSSVAEQRKKNEKTWHS